MTRDQKSKSGAEAPEWKLITIVIIVTALLTIFSWMAWFKFNWFD